MTEGMNVFNDAIIFLRSLHSLPPFEWDDNLASSALEHVMDIGPKGLLSYQSSDGTEPEDRITKYGTFYQSLGENIDFGPNDALGVVVSLTLDDGEAKRPHRLNLFKSDYKKIGIACGPHQTEFQMCVMDFAYDFVGFNDMNLDSDSNIEKSKDVNYNNFNYVDNDKEVNNYNNYYPLDNESESISQNPYIKLRSTDLKDDNINKNNYIKNDLKTDNNKNQFNYDNSDKLIKECDKLSSDIKPKKNKK